MEVVVVCNSKTGFTKRYADWIAEELNCSVLSYQDFMKRKVIGANDIVLFGSRIHAGKIEYLNKVKARFVDKKNLVVFATGATPASETSAIEKIWITNFTDAEINIIPHFYMQSGMNYERMGFFDRTIMKIVARLLGGKKNKSETEKGFEQAIKNSYDSSSKENIAPFVYFVRDKYELG